MAVVTVKDLLKKQAEKLLTKEELKKLKAKELADRKKASRG